MLTHLDLVVIAIYLVGVVFLGLRLAGRQTTQSDYFVGGRDLPWWVVCFSVVATETSTLTVIGLPAVAYGGSLVFLQLTLGYLLGRTVVSVLLLPRYFSGRLMTTYGYLGERFGPWLQGAASVTFLGTRLLADGVRLFATAIPLKVIVDAMGYDLSYGTIIASLVALTLVYTYLGGIRAVIWVDGVQLLIYLTAGVVAIAYLWTAMPTGWWGRAADAGKTVLIDLQWDGSIATWLTTPYAFVTAVVGGAVFSMASHGADQLMVQRLLSCRSLRDSQKALVGSAFLVMLQFAMFLFIGLMLWVFYGGADPISLGVSRGDEILPKFIIEGLPAGVSGLLLAGIVAAAMSTLSSSVNSLASSSTVDLYQRFRPEPSTGLLVPRLFTFIWALLLAAFAASLTDSGGTVIELGLSIASFTYGALLGVFLLGVLSERPGQTDALIAFVVTVSVLVLAVFGLWHSASEGWVFVVRPNAEEIARRGLQPLAWPWFPALGSVVTLVTGLLLATMRRASSPSTPG